jgi:nucleoside 2-deoxyribosyltransferase
VGDYLAMEKGALAFESSGFVKGFYSITPKGWSQIEALRHGDIKSDRGFVAMWFDKSMDAADVTIGAAIREAGYRAVRLDRHEHNNRIDDEILAGIRRSKFVVADLTGQRGGVYFEAGFALGLGIPVIWLCRKDDMAKIHFDNRQYNFILWEEGKLAELSKALQNRIEATIGRGPSAGST